MRRILIVDSTLTAVLTQYNEALARLPSRLNDLVQSTSLSVEAFNPDADLKALIEGDRTGPFRPQALIYESLESDVPEVNFGIDLRRWSGEFGWKGMLNAPKRPRGAIPDVLAALLLSLTELYNELPDEERRRSWIYEVPLQETHALRNSINKSRSSLEEQQDMIKRFNVPVVAGVVKLYLLELSPPVIGWEGWEDAKAVYPTGELPDTVRCKADKQSERISNAMSRARSRLCSPACLACSYSSWTRS